MTEIDNAFNLKVEKVVDHIKGILELDKSLYDGNTLEKITNNSLS